MTTFLLFLKEGWDWEGGKDEDSSVACRDDLILVSWKSMNYSITDGSKFVSGFTIDDLEKELRTIWEGRTMMG